MGGQGSTASSFICTVDFRRVSSEAEVGISFSKVKVWGGQTPKSAQRKRRSSLVFWTRKLTVVSQFFNWKTAGRERDKKSEKYDFEGKYFTLCCPWTLWLVCQGTVYPFLDRKKAFLPSGQALDICLFNAVKYMHTYTVEQQDEFHLSSFSASIWIYFSVAFYVRRKVDSFSP